MADDVYEFVADQGLIIVDAGVILTQVADEYKNTFGQDLAVPDSVNIEGASTPQGLLIVSEALARIAVADNNAAIANQINPNIAGGIFLDAIMALMGIQRSPATYTSTDAVITGVAGTFIPEGSQAQTAAGFVFATTLDQTIPDGGTLNGVNFKAVLSGAIACPADSLTSGDGGSIISSILGWESISSNTEGVLGQATQSDIAARQYRNRVLGAQGSSVAEAIIAGVSLVDGVKSMTFRENISGMTQTIDGVEMVGHSIYGCVDGGTDLAVANAFVSKKSAGSAYNNTAEIILDGTTTSSSATITMADTTGVVVDQYVTGTGISVGSRVVSIIANTSIVISIAATGSGTVPITFSQGIAVEQEVVIPFSGQIMTVLFDRPTPVSILVDVTVKIVTPVQNPDAAVKQAILDYASGAINGIPGLVVGQAVSSFELAGAITNQYPGIYVQSLLIAIDPTSPTSSDEIPIQIYEIAEITSGGISVTIA